MENQRTYSLCRGKWKFKGQTTYGFDELDLTITNEQFILIKKLDGKQVDRIEMSAHSHYPSEHSEQLMLGSTYFVEVDPLNENRMKCGEITTINVSDYSWAVMMQRDFN